MLPEWAIRKTEEHEMVPFQQCYTKDGRRTGNAMIVEMGLKYNELAITIVTDAGNLVKNLTRKEFDELFYLGDYVMKDFVTTEAARAWNEYQRELIQ